MDKDRDKNSGILFFIILSIFIGSNIIAQTDVKVKDLKWQKTKDFKLEITYSIPDANVGVSYKLNISIFDKKNNPISVFALSGDYPEVSGPGKKSIIWDVLKDIQDFPTIKKIEINITDITLLEVKEKVAAEHEPLNIPRDRKSKGNIPDKQEKNSYDTSFTLTLFGYEYDTKSEVSNYSILGCSLAGFTWVPLIIERVKIEDGSFNTIYSTGTNLAFKCGGHITSGLNICFVGGIVYSTNSFFAVNKNDNTKNTDKISNTKYFYGLELNAGYKALNFYVKFGQTNSSGSIEQILPNKNYAPKINFETGKYQSILLGIRISGLTDDFLNLW